MTRPRPDCRSLFTLVVCGLVGASMSLCLAGCGGGEEEAPAVQAGPTVRAPQSTLEDLDMDPRVQFPETREPSTRELAEAIADFASGFVQGDHALLSDLMDDSGKSVLAQLRESGQWKQETGRIETIRVCVLEETDTACTLGLGVQDPDGAYVLAWHGSNSGGAWTFSPMPIQNVERDTVAMLDGASLVEPELQIPAESGASAEPDEDADDEDEDASDSERR